MLQNATYFSEIQTYHDKYRAYEYRDADDIFAELMEGATYLKKDQKTIIQKSYEIAKKAHEGQKRKSGTPYITHPLTVACMMLPYEPCEYLISGALLHDVLEDTNVTFDEIKAIHPRIATIVQGATKIRAVTREGERILPSEQAKFETIRKILIASQKDIKILFLKIFDRFHNMITVDGVDPESARKMAQETRDVYVPLAKRSGLREVYHYLLGLSVEVLEPEKWLTMKTFVENKESSMRKTAEDVIEYLKGMTWSKKIIRYDIRFLSPFSLEMTRAFQEDSWYSIQIVVKHASDCYEILHDIGRRQDDNILQVGRMNDLINQPRLSRYAGLHVDVIFRGTNRIKLRVLTRETYEQIQEYHTFEYLGNIYASVLFRDFDLINEATASDSETFMKSVTEHILARKIPLHATTKPLFYLPIKSTALDAVISLAPEEFRYVTSIYRNHEKIPFYTVLENDDIITFEIGEKSTIQKEWANFVHSGVSKWRIEKNIG